MMVLRNRLGGCVILCALLTPCTSAGADFLDVLPEKPALLLYAPSVGRAAKSLAAFGQSAAIPPLTHLDAKALLEDVVEKFDGLDIEGPFAVLFLPGAPREPVAYLRVTDANAWKTASNTTGDKILHLTEVDGDELFAIIRDGVLLLSNGEGALEDAAALPGGFGKTLAAGKLTPGENAAFMIYADVPAWADTISQGLGAAAGLMKVAMANAPNGESVARIMDWYLSQARELTGQTQRVVLEATVNGDGVRAALSLQARPDTTVAKYLEAIQPREADLLRGLPERPYLVAFGSDFGLAPGTSSASEYFLNGMLECTKSASQPDQSRLKALNKEMSELALGGSFGMGISPDGMEMAGCTWTSNAARLAELTAEQTQLSSEMAAAWAPGMKFKSMVANEVIAGHKVTSVTQEFTADDPMMNAAMSQMFGGGSLSTYWAEEKGQLILRAGTEAHAKEAITRALQGNEKALSAAPRVRSGLARLTRKPLAVGMMDMMQAVRMNMPGGASAAQLPSDAETPPVVCGVSVSPRTAHLEIVVPADLIADLSRVVSGARPATSSPAKH